MTRLTLTEGLAALARGQYETVHGAAIELIKKDVHDALAYFLLGVIASDHQNFGKAVELFEKAGDLDPSEPYHWVYLAKTLSTLGRQNAAKKSADKARILAFNDAHLADTLGVVYSRAGCHERAIPLFEKAVALNTRQSAFHYNLGASAQFMGDFVKAKRAYENAIALEPHNFRARSSLVSLDKQTPDKNDLDTLIRAFDATSDADERLHIGHALAKTYEDLDCHEESLDWLIKAKTAKRAQYRYDQAQGKALVEAAKRTFPAGAPLSSEPARAAPIFVVGMPRTGTTLVDRIVSSHPDVVSAGELNLFAELIKAKSGTASNYVMDPETLDAVAASDIADIGAAYMDGAKDRAHGSARLVDKMPLNFFYAGLIHRALPNARIIALRRGAMDSCLSNFRQLFSTQYSYYNYTFDLADTAEFYRLFDRLMTYWRETLRSDRFTEVRYEDIIFDQEKQTRRLLEFCDLSWNEACLRFHENKAPVSTASSVQVRQPLYAGSIGRWKKYGAKLNALRDRLGKLAD